LRSEFILGVSSAKSRIVGGKMWGPQDVGPG
jgi:hypothetical protein